MQAYALKAAREGKLETSWLNPHPAYEAGLKNFIAGILDRATSGEFLESLEILVQRVSLLGALNSLSQITLKATLPGVPDFYQGTEFWDFSFVDPDNRRPVDFAERASALAAMKIPDWKSLAENWQNGHLKLAWTRQLLKLRTELAEVFTEGDYRPLQVSGPHRDHIIAFARQRGNDVAVVAVAKSFGAFTDSGRTWPRGDAFQGTLNIAGYAIEDASEEVPLSALFQVLPTAVVKARAVAKPARKRLRA
jgi:(1->4)-alpha-D-glucan 1-alpha-D-glucosylmutase